MKTDVLERFLRYVQIDTTSEDDVEQIPSTPHQFTLAKLLTQELKEMGINEVKLKEKCVVLATIPANLPGDLKGKIPTICFNAHLDTSPEEPGNNVKPQVINYQDGPIVLPGDPSVQITLKDTPTLANYRNQQLVTSDGTTLLGADDKAGIAEIMAAIQFLLASNQPHGQIKILFTPDEEVGKGPQSINIEEIGADFAYTIDGGEMGELEIECFNAVNGCIQIEGYNIHPGYAYEIMVNSIRILPKILELFPIEASPERTRDREGYYHPYHIESTVSKTELDFILRDFDKDNLEQKIKTLQSGIKQVRAAHPEIKIVTEFKHVYRNMIEILDQHPEIIQIAREAIEKTGLDVKLTPIRGGTDGAQFSFMGLPTPNIFTGGVNAHSKKEFVSVLGLEKAVDTILNIIEITMERARSN